MEIFGVVYVVREGEEVRAYESALQAVNAAMKSVFDREDSLMAAQDSWRVREGRTVVYATPARKVYIQQVSVN